MRKIGIQVWWGPKLPYFHVRAEAWRVNLLKRYLVGANCADPARVFRTSSYYKGKQDGKGRTLTGLGRVEVILLNCSAMLMTTLPPNEWPTRTSGNSLICLKSVKTSLAEVTTVWGSPGRVPKPAESPWHLKSTTSTCHPGNPCKILSSSLFMGVGVCYKTFHFVTKYYVSLLDLRKG